MQVLIAARRGTWAQPDAVAWAAAAAAPAAFLSTAAASWAGELPQRFGGLVRSLSRSKYPAEPLQPGRVSPAQPVPPHIERPPYAAVHGGSGGGSGSGGAGSPGLGKLPEIHGDERARAAMRAAGRLAAEALAAAGALVAPGVTTDRLDRAAHEYIVARGGYPSPLGYHGFPKSICTSVNEVVCHGIPDSRELRDGDIVNIDVTAYLGGYHGDTNATFAVGRVSPEAAELVEVARACLDAAIRACAPGVPFRTIGHTIHRIADAEGMSVVREFVGHGIGRQFHAAPAVLHHRNWRPGQMELGQTFTIEPILTLGSRAHRVWADGWTAVTVDGSLTAQFEHTLIITPGGVEVLTAAPE